MNEEMPKEDINEAENQMIEDPELDARMNEMEKESQIKKADKCCMVQQMKTWELFIIKGEQNGNITRRSIG